MEKMESYDELIKKCIEKREKMGLTVHKLADEMGVNTNHINSIESGKIVYSRSFLRYLEALEIDIIV